MSGFDKKSSFIGALADRLENILPFRTGYSLAEVELNSQFIITTNLILKNSKPNEFNGHQDFFSDILNALVAILENLNIDSSTGKLVERSENVLTSSVILTRLLRIISITNWNPDAKAGITDDSSLEVGVQFDSFSSITKDNFEFYALTEPPRVNISTCHVLDVLFTLLSSEVNIQALADIRKFGTASQKVDYSVSESSEISPSDIRPLILEIDSNISILLRFIAASNSADYANFVRHKLFSWADRHQQIPLTALQRYGPSLMYVYSTPNNTSFYLRSVYNAIPFIRSNTWKQLLLHYESMNLRTQCINKPGFYSNVIYAGSSAEQECKIIFDFISTAFENESNFNFSLYSWYVILCPSDFDELLSKSGKLKQVFNKRVKFLHSVLKDSQAGLNLDCFESLVSIMLLGSLLPEADSGVRKFSTKYLDDTYKNLLKMRSKCVTESHLSRYRKIYRRLYTAAIAIKPEKYIPLFILAFQQQHEVKSSIFYDSSKIIESHDHLQIVIALSSQKHYRESFELVMKQINATVSNIMHSCAQILLQNKDSLIKSKWSSDASKTGFMVSSEVTVNDCASSNSNFWVTPSRSKIPEDHLSSIESIFQLTLDIYTQGPNHFLQFQITKEGKSLDEKVAQLIAFANQIFIPLNVAIHIPTTEKRNLFKSVCQLSMRLLRVGNEVNSSDEVHCTSTLIARSIIHSTCEVIGSLTYPAFKEYFVFLQNFLSERMGDIPRARKNLLFQSHMTHAGCEQVSTSLDKLLMLCLCNHDVQFFSLLKLSIKAHEYELSATNHIHNCFRNSLAESFKGVMGDDIVFTGFVSLHRKFKSILVDFEPTRGLYEAWIMIYDRWSEMISDVSKLNDDNFTFKHYTEFLTSTSGCFLDGRFARNQIGAQEEATKMISAFYDQAVSLLKCEVLFIRVVIREALCSETHSVVYQLIYDKLMGTCKLLIEKRCVSADSVTHIEESVSIFTAILNIKTDGALLMAGLFPDVVGMFFDYVNNVPNPADQIKLKLRLAKLTSVVAASKEKIGISGAYKLRNVLAKTASEWLDAAVSYNPDSSPSSPTSSVMMSQGRASDVEYLQIELATECAKCFALQLESLVLSVPDATRESNFEQAKNLVFSNYFSLFYKIFQKFNRNDPSPLMIKTKFKIQSIIEHVLKAISNMLKANVGIGLQFALPLGYHENDMLRPIFLDIFATTLSAGKLKLNQEEFPNETIYRLAEFFGVYGAAAMVASPAEHNLLANSLNSLFGYTMHLDKLFLTLLEVEIHNVNRASDIFRGNSTLTRLMSIFAKEYGTPYLSVVLRPFVEEMVDSNVVFEVERESKEEDVNLFLAYLKKLVNSVVTSMPWVPESFRFICREIYRCVGKKFDEASLIAVGSFVFLRFFCPAIVSPESFFDLTSVSPQVKRSLMQIVKTIQYMANGSISNLKWASLVDKSDVMNEMSDKIFAFMKSIAVDSNQPGYVFHRITLKPLSSLRYIHKFFYDYFVEIRHKYLAGDFDSEMSSLQQKMVTWRKLDSIMVELGNPKSSISLQGTKSYKIMDTQFNLGNAQFAEFMAKMSAKNIETSIESPIIRNTVFHDGTPVIVIAFRHIKEISFDVGTLVYLILENVGQISENPFYLIIDLTQFFYMGIIGKNFFNLLATYAPKEYFANCKQTYYYNLPRASHLPIIDAWSGLRRQNSEQQSVKLFSEQDSPEIINTLCLSETTLAIPSDVKLVCTKCKLFDDVTHEFTDVTIKLGRSWLSIWFKRREFIRDYTATTTVAPTEVLKLDDLVKCEISNKSGENNELTLYLNRYNYQVTLVTPQRQEILRFLYFAMLRTSKQLGNVKSAADELEAVQSQRFSAISTLSFHGLLHKNVEVRTSASNLLKSFSAYYDITFDPSSKSFSKASFPVDMTDFVVSYSANLAKHFPQYSHEFLKVFFANFDKFTATSKISGIMYISPWVVNLHEHVSKEIDSSEKLAFIVRHLCKITLANPLMLPFIRELIWKRIFADMRMTEILVDELVAMAMEVSSENEKWNLIISVFQPSVELCGELVSRLHYCISKTKKNDSEIALQSKISEISTLVKVCASLFFDSYVFGHLYLSDVVLFCTLFIDRSDLDFGHDLQSLVLNTIQSFARNPSLNEKQLELVQNTVEYFSGQRAKMLFGLTTKERGAHVDFSQSYERSVSFEHLCDYWNNFIAEIGSPDDRRYWSSRWSSLSKDVAFSNSFFQMRAYTIVCTLARSGVSDSVGGRIMEVLTSPLFDNPDTYFEGSVCFLRLMQGLANDSVYLPLLVWIVCCALLSDFPLNYQAMISSIGKSFEKMIEDESFAGSVFAYRVNVEPLLSRFEQRVGVKIGEDNHGFIFLFLISKGLTSSLTRHTSVTTIRRILQRQSERKNGYDLNNLKLDDYSIGFLLVFYFAVPDSTFQKLLGEIGLSDLPQTQLGRDSIPDILLETLYSHHKPSQLAFLVSAHIFSGECEQVFKLKFIGLYEKLLEKSRDAALSVFHVIWAKMEDSFVNAASNSLSNDISTLLMEVVRDRDYSCKSWQEKIRTDLKEVQVLNVGMIDGTGAVTGESESIHRMTLVRQMFYQNLCSAVDGSKLERY